ncbi:hypothetical protein Thimo_3327 [Thioflavicoccus mobilis 8321]|uniref:Uncharacterized protein n=1 Tax=Thioflavicoccus mobilis 8321 TaxID=765912 RepID=L0H347_9GAMM|nr:hypothetical protein [Thioflavicoccus mobilis]AGA91999.1 hypothetical protein Thimo_3327 [Thioflavicoccus mobilis 8321]
MTDDSGARGGTGLMEKRVRARLSCLRSEDRVGLGSFRASRSTTETRGVQPASLSPASSPTWAARTSSNHASQDRTRHAFPYYEVDHDADVSGKSNANGNPIAAIGNRQN